MAERRFYGKDRMGREREEGARHDSLLAVLSVINSLIGLYVTPVLLGQVESGVSPMQLVLTAVSFTLALMLCGAVTAYIHECEMYGKISTRGALISAMNEKGAVPHSRTLRTKSLLSSAQKRRMQRRATHRRQKQYGERSSRSSRTLRVLLSTS